MNLKARLEKLEALQAARGGSDAERIAGARRFDWCLWKIFGEAEGEPYVEMTEEQALTIGTSAEFEAALDRIFADDEMEDTDGN